MAQVEDQPIIVAAPDRTEETTKTRKPPPPPDPASDPQLVEDVPEPRLEISSPELAAQSDDIFHVSPLAALKLLGAGIEALVRITGDIPPTPPPTSPTIPNMSMMQAEKESIVRSHSQKSLVLLLEQAEGGPRQGATPPPPPPPPAAGLGSTPPLAASSATPLSSPQPIDGVQFRTRGLAGPSSAAAAAAAAAATTTTPTGHPQQTREPYIIIGANSQPLNLQHSAITRKFYSKKPPPISITEYLLRLHRFCPMSTAVYLATSLYIHRLAVAERTIVVTARNAHRLLLAGLRVAMKALEDLSYQLAKVAKVGGVSEAELARLEISFCFLCSFEFMVREEVLASHWRELRAGRGLHVLNDKLVGGVGKLRIERALEVQG
jgi:hypothetical protein